MAITVVLAAVLYVLASGFFTVTNHPRSIGVAIVPESDGNFTLKIVTSIPGLTAANTYFSSVRGSDILTPRTALANLDGTVCAAKGALYVDVGGPSTVDAGDHIVLVGLGSRCLDGSDPTQDFVYGDSFDISDQNGIVWSGKIQ